MITFFGMNVHNIVPFSNHDHRDESVVFMSSDKSSQVIILVSPFGAFQD